MRLRILDRYVVGSFLRIFAVCVLGVPFLFIVVDLADHVDRYLAEGAGGMEILLHYVYQFPYQALLAFPIASLLSAVFTISTMTRHFETTAAKAGGVSFHRLCAPLLVTGFLISLVSLALTEFVPATNRLAEDVLGQNRSRGQTVRQDFVFRGNEGRFYLIQTLDTRSRTIQGVQVEREGTGFDYPTYTVRATGARWVEPDGRWVVEGGRARFLPRSDVTRTFRFRELWQKSFTETPEELLADPKNPDEMGYEELGRYIEAVQRSGGTARELQVNRALKIAFPFACFLIVLFGAPLAHTNRRGGPSVSVGLALATTILFLVVVRLAEALGAGGVLHPTAAAWLPNALFLVSGTWMTLRVQT